MSDDYNSDAGTYWRLFFDRQAAEKTAKTAGRFSRKRALRLLHELEENDGLPAATERYAGVLLREELKRAWAQLSPGANKWHPRLLAHLPDLSNTAASVALQQAGDDPLLRTYLTPQTATSIAHDEVAAIQRVIRDPTIYLQRVTWDGTSAIVLQHAASGLRGRFHQDTDGFGVIFSKPYAIDSIDHGKPNDHGGSWERYVGVGIGRRIYLLAARLDPQRRWDVGILNPEAVPLRDRLHGADPFHWATNNCTWCIQHNLDWRSADAAAFTAHPVTPAPMTIPPHIITVP